jgi:hypothetical protein
MSAPGVIIEVLASPNAYTQQQLDRACTIAYRLNRGKLLLVEEPQNPSWRS